MNVLSEASVQCPECFTQQTIRDFNLRAGIGKDAGRNTVQWKCLPCGKVMEVFVEASSLSNIKKALEGQ